MKKNDNGNLNPFSFVNEINFSKKDIMIDDVAEKSYAPFIVNRQLSYFYDTAIIANAMNYNHTLGKKLQFHFLLNMIRKKKRFSKWQKPEKLEALDVIKEYYDYSNEKAESALKVLNDNQIDIIRKRINKGGRS